MTDKKTKTEKPVETQEEEFEFSIEEKPAVSPPVENKKVRVGLKPIATPTNKKEKLQLDESIEYKPRSTRGELYNELQKKEQILNEDVYEYAPPILRAVAFIIDNFFYTAIGFLCINIAPLEMKLWDFFLNKYSLKLDLARDFAQSGVIGLNILISLFVFIAIPLAFFNRTLGKKFTGLHVRGEGQYTISIVTAFKREVIWKPISLGLLVGIVMPFFTKNKQSLHDKMCGTIVIK
jgi:uncharacterized RDD family membrane protein YckC